MSTSKSIPSFDAPPPSYSESLFASQLPTTPDVSPIARVIEHHILPQLHGEALNGLVLIPSDVSSLSRPPESAYETLMSKEPSSPLPFPGESLVGIFRTYRPKLIRLSGVDNTLGYWQRLNVIAKLEDSLRGRLRDVGYRVVQDPPKAAQQLPGRIVGSRNVDWSSVEPRVLHEGEARVTVHTQDVCLRIQNEMGLYETRTGRAVIVKVEVGQGDEAGN